MGLIIKIHRADGSAERVITKSGDVDVEFFQGGSHKPFMRFNKDEKTDVSFSGKVYLHSDNGNHIGTVSVDGTKLP